MNLTPHETAQLAQLCINNFLTQSATQFALREININPASIPSAPDDRTYFTNTIEFLSSHRQLENWVRVLSKDGIKFAQEWLADDERLYK